MEEKRASFGVPGFDWLSLVDFNCLQIAGSAWLVFRSDFFVWLAGSAAWLVLPGSFCWLAQHSWRRSSIPFGSEALHHGGGTTEGIQFQERQGSGIDVM